LTERVCISLKFQYAITDWWSLDHLFVNFRDRRLAYICSRSSGHILLCSVRCDWSLDGLDRSYGLALSEVLGGLYRR
jgi:hypothetical protein